MNESQYELEEQVYNVLLIAIPIAFYFLSKHLLKSVFRPTKPDNLYYNWGGAGVLYLGSLLLYLLCKGIWGVNLKIFNMTMFWHVPLTAVAILSGVAAFLGERRNAQNQPESKT